MGNRSKYAVITITPDSKIKIHEYDEEEISEYKVLSLIHKKCNKYEIVDPSILLEKCEADIVYDVFHSGSIIMFVDTESFFHDCKVNKLATILSGIHEEGKAILGTVAILALGDDMIYDDMIALDCDKYLNKIVDAINEVKEEWSDWI